MSKATEVAQQAQDEPQAVFRQVVGKNTVVPFNLTNYFSVEDCNACWICLLSEQKATNL